MEHVATTSPSQPRAKRLQWFRRDPVAVESNVASLGAALSKPGPKETKADRQRATAGNFDAPNNWIRYERRNCITSSHRQEHSRHGL
jgi:hypothetical protein